MPAYRPASRDFTFTVPIPELEPFADGAGNAGAAHSFLHSFPGNESPAKLVSATRGWAAGAERLVEVFEAGAGFLLKVQDCGEYFVAPHGTFIGRSGFQPDSDILSQMDREVLLGPVIVLALALQNVWSLHCGAALYNDKVIAFLGESGMGKSTLSAYLSKQTGWQLVADDILPLEARDGLLQALPHFPQLKLPPAAQPGARLPERLPLDAICVLEKAPAAAEPELRQIDTAQAVQAFLSHVAGTRMFGPKLLASHLQFAAQAAAQLAAYKLTYPHRKDTLPLVQELLEQIIL